MVAMEKAIMECRKILFEESNKLEIIAHQVPEEFHAAIERSAGRILDPFRIFRLALGIKDWMELDSKYMKTEPETLKEAEDPTSGYFIRIGAENKDLITECTAQEFRDWMRKNGINIDFISDRTLDAEDLKFRHEIRRAFLLDLRAKKEAES